MKFRIEERWKKIMEKKFKFNVILRPQRPLRPFYVHREH